MFVKEVGKIGRPHFPHQQISMEMNKRVKFKMASLFLMLLALAHLANLDALDQIQDFVQTVKVDVYLEPTTTIHIWYRPINIYVMAKVELAGVGGSEHKEVLVADREPVSYFSESWFDFGERTALGLEGHFQVRWNTNTTRVAYIYAYEPEKVLVEGIRQLFVWEAARPAGDYSGGFNFRAPTGWINDPAGFSQDGEGRFHMFYQHYPCTKQWFFPGLHWGHAVSSDLVHWVHLPVFLTPRRLNKRETAIEHTGGAIALPSGGLMAFWTQRRSDLDVDAVPFVERQLAVVTKDYIRPQNAMRDSPMIIDQLPNAEFGIGNRDPNVFLGPGGRYFMLLGYELRKGTGGVIGLWRSESRNVEDLDKRGNWKYQGEVLRDGRDMMYMAECAGLVPLGEDASSPDTDWVLMYGGDRGEYQKRHIVDSNGRHRMSKVVVGKFHPEAQNEHGFYFTSRFEQHFDIVGGASAYQAIYDSVGKRAVAMGWLFDDDLDSPSGEGSLTLPKEFQLVGKGTADEHLRVAPARKLAVLRHTKIVSLPIVAPRQNTIELASLDLRDGKPIQLELGTAELEFHLEREHIEAGTPFELVLTQTQRHGPEQLHIRVDKLGIFIRKSWAKDGKRLEQLGARASQVRVFVDLDSVEVFFDGGRWTGTVRLPHGDTQHRVQSFQLVGNSSLAVNGAEVWLLKDDNIFTYSTAKQEAVHQIE